jgi:hypothetical protein
VKSEDIDLKAYGTVPELAVGLDRCWWCDHHERAHQAWRSRTPAQVYVGELAGSSRQEAGERQPQCAEFNGVVVLTKGSTISTI